MLISNQLKKRIITSAILFLIVGSSVLINKVIFLVVLSVISILSFYEWSYINNKHLKGKKKNIKYIKGFGLTYIAIFYISSIIIYTEESKFFFIFLILVCAFSDIGGYIFGKLIGGFKLTKISPNKTVSGCIGSFLFSLIPLFLFDYKNFFLLDLVLSFYNILFCLVISLSCQIGDLIISYFKRLNKVKDTGKILPGHGGFLDRIDGIIFAIPAALVLLEIYSF